MFTSAFLSREKVGKASGHPQSAGRYQALGSGDIIRPARFIPVKNSGMLPSVTHGLLPVTPPVEHTPRRNGGMLPWVAYCPLPVTPSRHEEDLGQPRNLHAPIPPGTPPSRCSPLAEDLGRRVEKSRELLGQTSAMLNASAACSDNNDDVIHTISPTSTVVSIIWEKHLPPGRLSQDLDTSPANTSPEWMISFGLLDETESDHIQMIGTVMCIRTLIGEEIGIICITHDDIKPLHDSLDGPSEYYLGFNHSKTKQEE